MITYRQGQGNVVRGVGAGILGLVALFGCAELGKILSLWEPMTRVLVQIPVSFLERSYEITAALASQAVLFLGCMAGVVALLNYPKLVDFLIETEEEMRKVSWPWDRSARGVVWGVVPAPARELVGNAAVVLVSVVFLAAMLGAYDWAITGGMSWFLGL